MINIHEWSIALILGIIEGLTEFLPISSTGHMILVGSLFGFINDKAKTFEIIVQLGAVSAVIGIFWRLLFRLIGIYFDKDIIHKRTISNQLYLWHILLGIMPAMILGIIFYKYIKAIFSLQYVMYSLVLGGVLLLIGEYFKPKQPRTIDINNLTYLQAFLIGCFQCLALCPGFSRSGATIGGGLLVGVSRHVASEFSFILSVPITLGAVTLDLYHSLAYFVWQDIFIFIIGFVTAFIVALFVIKFFFKIIKNISFVPFAIYRFILAVTIYCTLIK